MICRSCTRLARRVGMLFAFSVLAGCAMPPGPANQARGLPSGTKNADVAGGSTPQAYGSGSARSGDASSESHVSAKPLTDNGPDVGNFHQTGRASWYGQFFHGHSTATGERYDMHALTAAHRTLPLGSYVRVTNPSTDSSVVVRINDRGPYARGRVIDLSYAAAKMLGLQHAGTARVKIEGCIGRRSTGLRGSACT